jgi:hypothetical protein
VALTALDLLEVAQAKYRYAYALDTRDWELYRSLLADPVTVDFRGLGYRGGPRQRPAEWWVGQVRGLLDGFDVTQHVMSSLLVEETGDGAALTAYLLAHHRLKADDPDERHYTIGGKYQDRLRRDNGSWVFTALTLHTMWTLGDETVMPEAAARARSAGQAARPPAN